MSEATTTSIGRPGAYAKGVARRQEILDRAIEVFAERGAEGASLRAIAERIGVAHATLLHYFDSREQLLIAVYADAEEKRGTVSAEQFAELSATGVIAAGSDLNTRVPGLVSLYSTLVAGAADSESGVARDFFVDRFARVIDELTEKFELGQREGTVRTDVGARELAVMLTSLSDGVQLQWLLDRDVDMPHYIGMFERLIRP